jgi:hypothetical protein
MIENKNFAVLLLAGLMIALPGAASAQIYAPRTTYGTSGIGGQPLTGIQVPGSIPGTQNGLIGPQNGSPTNGTAMLKTAEGAQSTITQNAPKEGQTNSGGQTVHYQVVDPNADGMGIGSDIVTDGLPKRVFNQP